MFSYKCLLPNNLFIIKIKSINLTKFCFKIIDNQILNKKYKKNFSNQIGKSFMELAKRHRIIEIPQNIIENKLQIPIFN